MNNLNPLLEIKALSQDLAEKYARKIADEPNRRAHWEVRHQDARDKAAKQIMDERRKCHSWGKRKYWELDANAVKSIKRNMKKHNEKII